MRVKGLSSMYGGFHATIQCLGLSKKWFLRLNVVFRLQSNVLRNVDVNVSVKKHNFKFPLILEKYNIMTVMQKLKIMQEFTFVINVECLHSSLQTKLLMHNCAHAKKMQKHVFVAYKVI